MKTKMEFEGSGYEEREIQILSAHGGLMKFVPGVVVSKEIAVTPSVNRIGHFVLTHVPSGKLISGDWSRGVYFENKEEALLFASLVAASTDYGEALGEEVISNGFKNFEQVFMARLKKERNG